MKKYDEVPQWWYLFLFVCSLAIGIGCSVSNNFTLWVILPNKHCCTYSILPERRWCHGGVFCCSRSSAASLPCFWASVCLLLSFKRSRLTHYILVLDSLRYHRTPNFHQIRNSNPCCVHSSWKSYVSSYAIGGSFLVRNIFGWCCSAVMYVNLYGNSTAYQTLAMLQGIVVLSCYNTTTEADSIWKIWNWVST